MEHIFMEEEQIILHNEIINLVNEINPERKKYVIKPHMDNLHIWDDKEFLRRFRVSKNTVLDIVAKIEEPLTHRTNRNHAVQPLQQLLLTLRYFATANFYITVADFGGLHKSTVGKIIPRVVYALTRLRHQYIAMPQTREEKEATAVEFHRVARFPRVVGAIDCTHVRLQSPGGNMAENFRNRKGYFSLNVQVVCNATTKITDEKGGKTG
ncbi:DDE superfamily endonuclease [Popillia japonica]|uniref:DDE superfamily endonuclease n=1 Tax=Popillia japonica TaxID=7064 RepID=A0AAW1I936_POPJA